MTSGEQAYYLCRILDGPVPLSELAAVAGARWAVEECFYTAQNAAGLEHYQVRRYRSGYRHLTLAMLAAAYLAVLASASIAAPDMPTSAPTWADEPEKEVCGRRRDHQRAKRVAAHKLNMRTSCR